MLPLALIALLAACSADSPPLTPPSSHAAHDQQADRVTADLTDAFGMTFEPAGPHHQLGKADDGVQLDLVGVPVEQVVLSLPEGSVAEGQAYLPHLRDLLHGPAPVYEWAGAMLACHASADDCEQRFEQGNLEAQVTRDEGYVVLALTLLRGPG